MQTTERTLIAAETDCLMRQIRVTSGKPNLSPLIRGHFVACYCILQLDSEPLLI